MSIEYEILPDPNEVEVCGGQSNNVSFSLPDTSFFGLLTNIPFDSLGKGGIQKTYLKVVSVDGKEEKIQIGGGFKIKAVEEHLVPGDITISARNDLGSLEGILRGDLSIGKLSEKTQDLTTKYKLSIKKNSKKRVEVKYVIDDIENQTVCDIGCAGLDSTGSFIEFDKTKLPTGKYKINVLDLSLATKPIVASHEFTITNPIATTFAVESKTNVPYTEIAYAPSANDELKNMDIDGLASVPQVLDPKPLNIFNQNESNPNCKFISFANPIIPNVGSDLTSYQTSILQKAIDKDNPGFKQLTAESCSNNNIVVGAVVDLTNPNTAINKKLWDENTYVLLSLSIENNQCQEIDKKFFSARIGTKHVITKSFFHKPEFGNFCDNEDKVAYVKVKRAVDTSLLSFNQNTYSQGVQKIDIFAKVSNVKNNVINKSGQNISYDGSRILLQRCKTEACYQDIGKIYDKIQANASILNTFKNAYARMIGQTEDQNYDSYLKYDFFNNVDSIIMYKDLKDQKV